MTNEEMKKEICKIIADNYLPKEMPDRLEDYKLYRFKRAADRLIGWPRRFLSQGYGGSEAQLKVMVSLLHNMPPPEITRIKVHTIDCKDINIGDWE